MPPRVTDEATGLFNAAFFAVTLDKRVSAARRGLRPLTLALLEPLTGLGGDAPTARVDQDVADVLIATLRDSDIACRLEDGLVALILEDTPENGAVWTVERVRRRLADRGDDIGLHAGVACYPAHAFDAEQLLDLGPRPRSTRPGTGTRTASRSPSSPRTDGVQPAP